MTIAQSFGDNNKLAQGPIMQSMLFAPGVDGVLYDIDLVNYGRMSMYFSSGAIGNGSGYIPVRGNSVKLKGHPTLETLYMIFADSSGTIRGRAEQSQYPRIPDLKENEVPLYLAKIPAGEERISEVTDIKIRGHGFYFLSGVAEYRFDWANATQPIPIENLGMTKRLYNKNVGPMYIFGQMTTKAEAEYSGVLAKTIEFSVAGTVHFGGEGGLYGRKTSIIPYDLQNSFLVPVYCSSDDGYTIKNDGSNEIIFFIGDGTAGFLIETKLNIYGVYMV